MKRSIVDFLNDILFFGKKANEIYTSASNAELSESFLKIQTLVRCLEVIGEAVKMIPPDVRKKYPDIPWKNWSGIRDVLIHKYWDLQEEIVFTTVEVYLPSLMQAVGKILKEEQLKKS